MAIETYDITTDFSDQDIYPSVLEADADAAGLTTCTSVDANANGNSNKVRFHFPAPLSAPDKTTLDGVVTAYDPAGTQPVASLKGQLMIEDVTAAATERVWAITTSGGTLTVGTCTDGGVDSDSAIDLARTGETATLATIGSDLTVSGDIAVTGTVDGRNVDADGTTLDALATHASTHSDGGTDEVTVENLATSGASGKVPTSDGSGGLTMETPSGGVFGAEFAYESDASSNTNGTTTFADVIRLPASGDITMPAGTYRLDMYCIWSVDSASATITIQPQQDGVDLGAKFSYSPASAGYDMEYKASKIFVLTADDYNWSFQFKVNSSSYEADTVDRMICIYRVA